MHSRYATGSPLRNEGSSTNINGSLPAKIESQERGKRAGLPWSVGDTEAEPRGGEKGRDRGGHHLLVHTDGLYESWRPDDVKHVASRGGSGSRMVQRGVRRFSFLVFALAEGVGGEGAATESALRGRTADRKRLK